MVMEDRVKRVMKDGRVRWDRRFHCDFCGSYYDRMSLLEAHVRRAHPDQAQEAEEAEQAQSQAPATTSATRKTRRGVPKRTAGPTPTPTPTAATTTTANVAANPSNVPGSGARDSRPDNNAMFAGGPSAANSVPEGRQDRRPARATPGPEEGDDLLRPYPWPHALRLVGGNRAMARAFPPPGGPISPVRSFRRSRPAPGPVPAPTSAPVPATATTSASANDAAAVTSTAPATDKDDDDGDDEDNDEE